VTITRIIRHVPDDELWQVIRDFECDDCSVRREPEEGGRGGWKVIAVCPDPTEGVIIESGDEP
jgi:hypothetical protein